MPNQFPTSDELEPDPFLRAVRAAGATSFSTAKPLRDLPPITDEQLIALLHERVIRESAPGLYFVPWNRFQFDPAESSRRPVAWARVALIAFACGVALLGPFLAWILMR